MKWVCMVCFLSPKTNRHQQQHVMFPSKLWHRGYHRLFIKMDIASWSRKRSQCLPKSVPHCSLAQYTSLKLWILFNPCYMWLPLDRAKLFPRFYAMLIYLAASRIFIIYLTDMTVVWILSLCSLQDRCISNIVKQTLDINYFTLGSLRESFWKKQHLTPIVENTIFMRKGLLLFS